MAGIPPNQRPNDESDDDDDESAEEAPWLEELEAVDREIRLERLKEEAQELGGEIVFAENDDTPTEEKIAFLEDMIEYERADEATPLEHLRAIQVGVIPPDELDDAGTTRELWRVIHGLARLGCYLHSTNHLSDSELYRSLWEEFLREPTVLLPGNPHFAFHMDFVDSGSDEDTDLWLRYYACDETRRRWSEDFPTLSLPPKEKPPFDRDRFLPEGPNAETEGSGSEGRDDEGNDGEPWQS